MLQFRPLLSQDRPFDLREHQYLKGIYEDEAREMVLFKAGQMGISEYLLSWLIWSADRRNATGLYVFPSDTHVSDFSSARLGPAIEPDVSPYLASLVMSGRDGHVRGVDRVGLKRVRYRHLYLRGAQVTPEGKAKQLKSIDADDIVVDELDEMDTRALPIARKRLEHSLIGDIRIASTPTYKGVGIAAEYERTDKREYFLKCPHCGERQYLTLESLVLELDALDRPVAWHGKDKGSPYVGCRKCHKPMDRSLPGEWIAEHPNNPIHGYHVFGLLSLRKSLSDILENLAKTNETIRKETTNQGLGLTYTSLSSQKLSDDVLNACIRDYGFSLHIPRPDDKTRHVQAFAGIDIGRVLHIVIRALMPDGDRPALFIGIAPTFPEAARILRQHDVESCVIDALPEGHSLDDFISTFPAYQIWKSFYNIGGVDKAKDFTKWNVNDRVVYVDRTRSLDSTFELFFDASKKKPGNTIPAMGKDIPDYFSQLKAPERKLEENTKGEQVAVYIESDDDHYAHAENYCNAAFKNPMAGGWSRG